MRQLPSLCQDTILCWKLLAPEMILRCAMFGFHNSEVLYFLFYAMQFFLPFFMMHFFLQGRQWVGWHEEWLHTGTTFGSFGLFLKIIDRFGPLQQFWTKILDAIFDHKDPKRSIIFHNSLNTPKPEISLFGRPGICQLGHAKCEDV